MKVAFGITFTSSTPLLQRADSIEQIAEAGARKIWVGVSGQGLDNQRHYLRILGEEIMPRFVS